MTANSPFVALSNGPDPSQVEKIRSDLIAWFLADRRILPWRSHPSPYRVWISEIMLQQTRVDTVVDYFERFMARFPAVHALAAASEGDVLALWSGLGYYSRARNLHRAAQRIVEDHGGELPRDLAALQALPGVGRYTAGAIASIAFGLPAPLLDGNVMRVFSRLFDIADDISLSSTQRELWRLAAFLVPSRDASAFNQGLMELGALVCTPRAARCSACPLANSCAARRRSTVGCRPVKAQKRAPAEVRAHALVVVGPRGEVLLRERAGQRLFGGLWEPVVEVGDSASSVRLDISPPRIAGEVRHELTHRRYQVQVSVSESSAISLPAEEGNWAWVHPIDFGSFGLSRFARKIIECAIPKIRADYQPELPLLAPTASTPPPALGTTEDSCPKN